MMMRWLMDMRFKPKGYTIRKLLTGWLAHLLISFVGGFVVALIGLDWTHAVAYPTTAYGFREVEQYRQRRRRGVVEVWPKTILDVLFASLGGGCGALVRSLI